MGAGIVTLTDRMITLGLADLKGHVGIGFDDGAWISSAYNIALIFIGPFTVYLGGLMGPSLMGMDVLEFSGDHTADGDVHLLLDSCFFASEEVRGT